MPAGVRETVEPSKDQAPVRNGRGFFHEKPRTGRGLNPPRTGERGTQRFCEQSEMRAIPHHWGNALTVSGRGQAVQSLLICLDLFLQGGDLATGICNSFFNVVASCPLFSLLSA